MSTLRQDGLDNIKDSVLSQFGHLGEMLLFHDQITQDVALVLN